MRACSLFLGPVLDQQHPGVAAHLRDKPTCAHTSRPGPSTAEELIEDASGRHITVVAVIARPQTACASQLARRAANMAIPPEAGSARSRAPRPPVAFPGQAKPARSMPAGPHRSPVSPLPSVVGGRRHRGRCAGPTERRLDAPCLAAPSLPRRRRQFGPTALRPRGASSC